MRETGKPYRRLGPAQSPVVSAAIDRKSSVAKASLAIRRFLKNGIITLLLLFDWYFCMSSLVLQGYPLLILRYVEVFVVIVLVLSCLHDLTLYAGLVQFSHTKVRITSSQCKKLGLLPSGSSFQLVSDPEPFGETVYPTPTSLQGHSPSHQHSFPSPVGSSYSPRYGSPNSSFSGAARSPSFSEAGQSPSPQSTRMSRKSPMSGEPMMDSRSLDRYLQQEEESLLQVSQTLFSSPQSASANNSALYDPPVHTPSPRKYHVAPRTSPSSLGGEFNSPYGKSLENCGIQRKDLDLWTERCRKWIATTIVKPLTNEISVINSALNKKGRSEQIGTVALDVLKRLNNQATPTLPMVIQYLDLTPKQEYLVERIKELAIGSYLSVYCWDAGGTWKGRQWTIDLPSDSQIIMHLLSTYLDSHLPPDPWFPNGKTFSTQYFLKSVPKNGSKQQSVCLVQTSGTPPVYKVLVRGKYINVAEGRNNLFHSICTFLHHVKTKEDSMLGTINLETAGINILSIISASKN